MTKSIYPKMCKNGPINSQLYGRAVFAHFWMNWFCQVRSLKKQTLIVTIVSITGHHLLMYRKQMQFYTTNYVQLTCRRNQYRNLGTSGSTTSDKSFLGFILEIQQKKIFFCTQNRTGCMSNPKTLKRSKNLVLATSPFEGCNKENTTFK